MVVNRGSKTRSHGGYDSRAKAARSSKGGGTNADRRGSRGKLDGETSDERRRRRRRKSRRGSSRKSSSHGEERARTKKSNRATLEETRRRKSSRGAVDGDTKLKRSQSSEVISDARWHNATTEPPAEQIKRSRHKSRDGTLEHASPTAISSAAGGSKRGHHDGGRDDSGYKTEDNRLLWQNQGKPISNARRSRSSHALQIDTSVGHGSRTDVEANQTKLSRSASQGGGSAHKDYRHGSRRRSRTAGEADIDVADYRAATDTVTKHRLSRESPLDNRQKKNKLGSVSGTEDAQLASTAVTAAPDILRRRSTRTRRIRLEDVDMAYQGFSDDDEMVIEEPKHDDKSDESYIDGPAPRDRQRRSRPPRRSQSLKGTTEMRASASANITKLKRNLSGSGNTTQQTSRSTSHRKPMITVNMDKQPTRKEAQNAGLQAHATEFSLGNLEHLAKAAVQEGTLSNSQLRARPSQGSVFEHRTSTKIVPKPDLKPTFFYREEGPLPRSEEDHYVGLSNHITQKGLSAFIHASHPRPREIASCAAKNGPAICHSLLISHYATPDLTKLGLYDVIVLCDDSSSMYHEHRYETLKIVVRRIARIAAAYNLSGIKIRSLNSTNDSGFNGIITEDQVVTCLDTIQLQRGTRLGTMLFEKVVNPLIVQRAKRGELIRPVVVSVVTDGKPTGEHIDTLKRTIIATKHELQKLKTLNGGTYGKSAVVFQISRVGSSSAAERYIESLKKDPEVAELIFCSDESLDYAVGEAKEQGQLNTWLTQLLAGAVKR